MVTLIFDIPLTIITSQDRNPAICLTLFHTFSTAPKGHFSQHAPHSVHFPWSITCGTFFAPVIASTGHAFEQMPQAVQVSA
jgi:hypothetical protein